MVLCRTFHIAPEQGQGLTLIVPHCSGSCPCPCPGTGHSQCDYTIRGEISFNEILCLYLLVQIVYLLFVVDFADEILDE